MIKYDNIMIKYDNIMHPLKDQREGVKYGRGVKYGVTPGRNRRIKNGILETEATGDLTLGTGALTGEKTAFVFGFIGSKASILAKRVDHSSCKLSKRLSKSLEGLETQAEVTEAVTSAEDGRVFKGETALILG